ncbi:hypothetical protein ACU4GI_39740 [Cupriavidus basilensis]|jgi:hypothetical protein|uniref:hypothetical protein n=1 Tax=Cupriavidus sp. SK-3 TaxID=1470558 RepID=UPI00044EBBBA|nr:hypothetical protein [Cupriavidus sp. SK-3]KDP85451.1 hypothetical protein CF70_013760 [Cupriavidus sp. SK-3]
MTTPKAHRLVPRNGAACPSVPGAVGSTRTLARTGCIDPAQAFQPDGPLQCTCSEFLLVP